MAFDLSGRRALVIGSPGRLTEALAASLAEAGATVARSDAATSAAIDEAVSGAAPLDVLVTNYDLVLGKPSTETSDDEWGRVLAANLGPVFFACRAAGALMLEQGRGKIVNVCSIMGERGVANSAAYCAAKGGVVNLTRALSAEWIRSGISVTGLGVGFLDGSPYADDPDLRHSLERYMPMRRLGLPEEIAPAIVYLASEESAFMSGQILYLEGAALSHI